jgi:REP element-mobilizing transposase RayT
VSFRKIYLITFRTHGTWLPGDHRGWVHRTHNTFGTPLLPPNRRREAQARTDLGSPAVLLSRDEASTIEEAIREFCQRQGWAILALAVRTNHVHLVIATHHNPDSILVALKATATTRLRRQGYRGPRERIWARGGSTRYLIEPGSLERAIDYVENRQGKRLR